MSPRGYTSSRAAASLLLLWEAEIGLGDDAEVDRLVKEQRSATAEPVEWRSSMQSQLMSTARFLASKGCDESAIFLIEQALIAGFKGVDRLSKTAEFRNLAEQAAFQDLIKRYSEKKVVEYVREWTTPASVVE